MSLISKIRERIFPKNEVSEGFTSSDLSLRQVLDYAENTGDYGVFNIYGVGGRHSLRNQAVTFAVYFRVITLLSSLIAQLITSGSLRIVNRNGDIDNSQRSRRRRSFL